MLDPTQRKHFDRLNFLAKLAEELPGAGNLNQGHGTRIAALLYVKNDLVSIGWNQMRSSPFQAKYGRNQDSIFLHAETHAISKALRSYDVEELQRSKTTLYLCRVKKHQHTKKYIWGLSKPCCGCMSAIVDFNIKNVVYSMDQDEPDSIKHFDVLTRKKG